MIHVLVTGGSGFVGQHLIKECLARNFEITVVLREGSQIDSSIVDQGIHQIFSPNPFLENSAWWGDVLGGVDIVIHSAWITSGKGYLESPVNTDCLLGTLEIAKAAKKKDVSKFVGLGTCIEYQLSMQKLKTSSPLNPLSLYAKSKAACYFSLDSLFRKSNTKFLWCRLFQIYGDGENSGRLIPQLHHSLQNDTEIALSEGNQVRDFLLVNRAVELVVDGAVSDLSGVANICSGNGQSVRQMALKIARSYKKEHLLKFGRLPKGPNEWEYIVGEPTPIPRQVGNELG